MAIQAIYAMCGKPFQRAKEILERKNALHNCNNRFVIRLGNDELITHADDFALEGSLLPRFDHQRQEQPTPLWTRQASASSYRQTRKNCVRDTAAECIELLEQCRPTISIIG
jgi:hypothetical protein